MKVVHDGVERRVLDDLDLMQAVATYLEQEDAELAQLRPTLLIDEFAGMMRDAIDLSQELSNLQRFTLNFAEEPDVVIPTPYPELSRRRVLTMSMITGAPFSDRASVEAIGWDVDALVRRAADVYLEMIFRDSLYRADPHPGNFLLPDATHMAILDFGDVGRLTGLRRHQLETMVIAVGTHDVDTLVDVVVEMTTPPPSVDIVALRSDIEAWLNRYLLVGVGHLDITGIMNSGMQLLHEHKLVLPADLALLFRVLLRLQGLGRGVGAEVRVTELLQPHVKSMMAQRFDPGASGVSSSAPPGLGSPRLRAATGHPGDRGAESAPATSASTSASMIPTERSTTWSTGWSRRPHCWPPRSSCLAGRVQWLGRSLCRASLPRASAWSRGNASSAAALSTRRGLAAHVS